MSIDRCGIALRPDSTAYSTDNEAEALLFWRHPRAHE